MNHLEAAVREIDERIEVIDAERAKLFQARETLTGLFTATLPLAKPRIVKIPAKRTEPIVAGKRGAKQQQRREAVLNHLSTGPSSMMDMESKTGLSRYSLGIAIAELGGLVTASGATSTRRYALTPKGSRAEPKEAVR